MECSKRGENILDQVYIRHAYRGTPLPHLGQSDHLSLLLSSIDAPSDAEPGTLALRLRTVTTRPEDELNKLQNRFSQSWTYLNTRIWRHSQELYWTTSSCPSGMCPWKKNPSGPFLTRSKKEGFIKLKKITT